MSVDLESMTSNELADLIKNAEGQIRAKIEAEKAFARTEVEALAKSRGFTIPELFDGVKVVREKVKLPATHRDPNNPENQWTGRGKKPKWLATALEAGGKIEDYKI